MKTFKKISVIFVLLLCTLSVLSNLTIKTDVLAFATQGVIVYGESQKTVTPDCAIIYSTIKMQNEDILTSKDDCLNIFSNIKQILIKNNILNENITIRYFNVYPIYDTKNYNQINGYNSNLDYEIKIDNLDEIDNIVSILIENGCESITNIQYKLSNFNEVYNEVLNDAKILATEKAKSILGKDDFVIKNIVEQEYFNSATLFKNVNTISQVLNQNNSITITAKVKMEVE